MCVDSFGNKEGAKSIVRNSRENLWIQVFLIPFSQVYKIKDLSHMDCLDKHVCERMGRSKDQTEFQHGAITGGQFATLLPS